MIAHRTKRCHHMLQRRRSEIRANHHEKPATLGHDDQCHGYARQAWSRLLGYRWSVFVLIIVMFALAMASQPARICWLNLRWNRLCWREFNRSARKAVAVFPRRLILTTVVDIAGKLKNGPRWEIKGRMVIFTVRYIDILCAVKQRRDVP